MLGSPPAFLDGLTLQAAATDIVLPRGVPPKRLHDEASIVSRRNYEPSETPPLSQRLRAGTTDLHHQAEKQLNIQSLIHDQSSYAETLKRYYGIYAPLERALRQQCGWDELGLDFKDRSHAQRIARDLAILGSEPGPLEAFDTFAITSFPHALGALYVMEGSTLGGRIILRHFWTQQMDIPAGAMSFFAGHGAETGSMWRSFVSKLDAFGHLNPASCDAVEEGAQRTFRAVIAWFEPFCQQMMPRP